MSALTLTMGQLPPKMAWWEKLCRLMHSLPSQRESEVMGTGGGSTHAL